MLRIFVTCLFTCLVAANASPDWLQFRGPNGSGVADDAQPPVEFGPDKNLLWRLELDSGHSSPIVSGDSVFLTTFDQESKQLHVVAIDREKGNVRWSRDVDAVEVERGHPSFNPASSTPVTDGERVVAYFGSFGLVCFDFEGSKLWELPLPLTKSYAGNAISPVIAGEKVILYRGNFVDHFLLAVDKRTGEELWRTPQSEPFHAELACTAIPIVHEDLLVLHGARSVQGFDLATGEQQWITKCATTATSTPLLAGGRVVVAAWNKMGEPALRPSFPGFAELLKKHDSDFDRRIQPAEFPTLWIFHRPEGAEAPQNGATIRFKKVDRNRDGFIAKDEWEQQLLDIARFRRGYQNHGLLSLPIDSKGVLADKDVVIMETRGIPEVPSPISDGRFVYLIKNGGQLTCIDLGSGERVYRKRTGGSGTHYASPVIAAGHLYLADGRGRIVVMTLGQSPRILATNEMGDRVYATPAISGSCIFVRTHSALYAFTSEMR
ncbi:MAG: PQQ-binding-like beta-propeller repeat protein [Planctomycetota bacterium]